MKKIEKMIHQIVRFRGNIEAFLESIEEFSRSNFNHKSKSDVQCVDGSRKAQKCKEDAYIAEINNDPLVAHSAM